MTLENKISAPEPTQPDLPRRSRRRSRGWVAGVILGATVIGGVSTYAAMAAEPPPEASETQEKKTAKIVKGTLSGTQTVPGVLDFAGIRGQRSTFSGVLTYTATPNSRIDQGGVLFAVDNVGVYLFLGELPAWRTFESGMPDGPDVSQLEQNLKALGVFSGEPDSRFTWDTVMAIRAWQEKTGQEKTGRVDLGRIVFAAQGVRVAESVASVGDLVGPGGVVMNVSGAEQEVTADMKLADQKLAVVGKGVEVLLPGGVSTPGTIVAVGQPTERDKGGQTTVVIPITIVLDTPADADGIQRANVSVDVPSDTREDVLYVPVDALLALPGGGFGVEVVKPDGTAEQVPVETGLFAGGHVEISGKNVKVGLEVTVPGS